MKLKFTAAKAGMLALILLIILLCLLLLYHAEPKPQGRWVENDGVISYQNTDNILLTGWQEIDGIRYIGLIEIPDLEISLPVIDYWTEDYLKLAPCRFSGSYYKNNLVLCAHSYVSHFRPLRWINMGTDVYFTTVTGDVYHYVVTNSETIYPDEREKMVINDANEDDVNDWDLTLFTCTADMQARCTVRCQRVYDQP